MSHHGMFSKSLYSSGVLFLFAFTVIDLMCNALADSTASRVYFVTYFSAQLISQVISLLAILVLMWRTFLFRFGLLGALCTRFQPIFIVLPLYFLFTIAFRWYRLVWWDIGITLLNLQTWTTYRALYYIQRTLALIYYVVAVRTTHILAENRFYKSTGWLT